MIFFVLSGYFITSSVVRAWPHWSWRDYLTDRLVRLYLVLLPGLVLTAVWDWVGRHWGCPALYEGRHPGAVFQFSAVQRSGFATFLANVVFLQTVVSPSFGTNSPLWSLCNEFWYYMLFPCLLMILSPLRPVWLRGGYLVVAAALLIFLGPEISLYFLVWLLGAAVRFIPPVLGPTSRVPRIAASCLAAAVFFLALLFTRVSPGVYGDFALGAGFAAWLYFLLHDEREGLPRWYATPAKTLAGGSYTLYVLHLPALAVIYSVFLRTGRWEPNASHLAALSLVLGAVFVYAYVLAQLTEGNTGRVRRSLRALWRTRVLLS